MKRHFAMGVRSGEPISFPGGSATPRSFAVALRLGPVAYTWNTPVGMDIAHATGGRERVQIVDVTRWALWALAALAIVAGTGRTRH